jgi:molecular chaperone DnaK
VRIDDDYIAHATLRSRNRQETAHFEFHQLDFGLMLPSSRGDGSGPEESGEADTSKVDRGEKASNSIVLHQSNVTLRSNVTSTDEDSWPTLDDWRMVPGDIVEQWQTDFIGPRLSELSPMQKDERDYNLPCCWCRRMLYAISSEGPNEICERHRPGHPIQEDEPTPGALSAEVKPRKLCGP